MSLDSTGEEVGRHDQIIGFLPAAESEIFASGVEFFRNLGVTSVKAAARRSGATAVDKCDVELAYKQVSGQKAAQKGWVQGVAGAPGGCAVGIMLTPPESHKNLWLIATVLLGLVALALTFYSRPRKL